MADEEDKSFSDSLSTYATGEQKNLDKLVERMPEWRQVSKRPYQITLLHKDREFTARLPISIGRRDTSFTVIVIDGEGKVVDISDDILASRFLPSRPGHALIYSNGANVTIKDLGSMNGTQVGLETLKKEDVADLKMGDSFTIGDTQFVVKGIDTEYSAIQKSEKLWTPFKYVYLQYIDQLIEANNVQQFIGCLNEFQEDFGSRLELRIMEELRTFIREATMQCRAARGVIPDEVSQKWYNVLKFQLGKDRGSEN